MSAGPKFYAVQICRRDDGVTLYLGHDIAPERRGQYKRESLDKAATFPERGMAEHHLSVFPELSAEVVELCGVGREPGNWRGWHKIGTGDRYTFHGPRGEQLSYSANGWGDPGPFGRATVSARPWTAYRPDGRQLRDAHDRPRTFGGAEAARRALRKVMIDEEGA